LSTSPPPSTLLGNVVSGRRLAGRTDNGGLTGAGLARAFHAEVGQLLAEADRNHTPKHPLNS
jgi:hypothetical protein